MHDAFVFIWNFVFFFNFKFWMRNICWNHFLFQSIQTNTIRGNKKKKKQTNNARQRYSNNRCLKQQHDRRQLVSVNRCFFVSRCQFTISSKETFLTLKDRPQSCSSCEIDLFRCEANNSNRCTKYNRQFQEIVIMLLPIESRDIRIIKKRSDLDGLDGIYRLLKRKKKFS